MPLKRCSGCGIILTTEAYNRGFDYCYKCYQKRQNGYKGRDLKRCLACGKILSTYEYEEGYDYHTECKD